MNILAIGNSFSEDATKHLYGIASADGRTISVINLYIPGCSLDRHYRNMLSGERAYELQCNGNRTGFYVSLDEALLNREWDVVTLQQASHRSAQADSYFPYIEELAAHIRRLSPKAKIYVHQTWAYEAGSDRLHRLAGYDTPEQMLSDIKAAYANAAEKINADGIIPSGELFDSLLHSGIESVHRDTYHATFALGRYALGLLWYERLCGGEVLENKFRGLDTQISSENLSTVKRCVEKLIKE